MVSLIFAISYCSLPQDGQNFASASIFSPQCLQNLVARMPSATALAVVVTASLRSVSKNAKRDQPQGLTNKNFPLRAIFLALPLTSKLDALCGGNANLSRFARQDRGLHWSNNKNKREITARAIPNKDFGAMHQYSSPCRLRASSTRSAAGMRTFFLGFTCGNNVFAGLLVHRQKQKCHPFGWRFCWWTNKDSNLGPTGYEPVALTN